jgi:hypothetical protein
MQLSLKYEQFMDDGVIIPMSYEYFSQITKNDTYNNKTFDASLYKIDILIATRENKNEFNFDVL